MLKTTLRIMTIAFFFLGATSISQNAYGKLGGWKCPCVTSTDPDHPAGTKVCSGSPEEGEGCDCNAFCS